MFLERLSFVFFRVNAQVLLLVAQRHALMKTFGLWIISVGLPGNLIKLAFRFREQRRC